MQFNFSPLDYSQGINWHTNQWNNIGNAIKSGADALDSFGKQKQQWDLMKQQEQEAAAKKAQFNNNFNAIQNAHLNDQVQADRLATRKASKETLENKRNEMEQAGQVWENDLRNLNTQLKNGEITTDQFYEAMDNLGEKPDTSEIDGQIENLDWSIEDAGNQMSNYAEYLNDPGFELALSQAQQNQDFSPVIAFLNGYKADQRYNNEFAYRIQRDQASDALQEKMLNKEAEAQKQAGISAKLAYKLDNELSALDGLKFGKDGRVKVGPYAGKSMEELVNEVASRYEGAMGSENFWNALMNHKTMSQYSKMMATRGSTTPPAQPDELIFRPKHPR